MASGAAAMMAPKGDIPPWSQLATEAKEEAKAGHFDAAAELLSRACKEYPSWAQGHLARFRLAKEKLGASLEEQLRIIEEGLSGCQEQDRQSLEAVRQQLASKLTEEQDCSSCSEQAPCLHGCPDTDEAAASSSTMKKKPKLKGVKLLPHEEELLKSGHLEDVTHPGASAIWLSAPSRAEDETQEGMVRVYRPMGDLEYDHLQRHGVLPSTQPYQTIVIGDEGRNYAEKYLRGQKSVDSAPTTVVEFLMPADLIAGLFKKQSKNEDGAISHGLGNKGGNGLPLFNEALAQGLGSYRIVFVKRFDATPRPRGMGGKRTKG